MLSQFPSPPTLDASRNPPCPTSQLQVLLFLSNSCCPWERIELKRMRDNWPRCWLTALTNMAGNRFMTFMVWLHLPTSFRSGTGGRTHAKPSRNSVTRGLYVRHAANGSESHLLLTTIQVT